MSGVPPLSALEQNLLEYDKICEKYVASKSGGLERKGKRGTENWDRRMENDMEA
jgi:hypothetical protein